MKAWTSIYLSIYIQFGAHAPPVVRSICVGPRCGGGGGGGGECAVVLVPAGVAVEPAVAVVDAARPPVGALGAVAQYL